MCVLSRFSCFPHFVTLWTVGHQAPLCIGFSRQKYWSGLPCPPLGNLPDPGIKAAPFTSPALEMQRLLFFFYLVVALELQYTFTPNPGPLLNNISLSLPLQLSWQKSCLQCRRPGFDSWVRKIPWRREQPPTPVS